MYKYDNYLWIGVLIMKLPKPKNLFSSVKKKGKTTGFSSISLPKYTGSWNENRLVFSVPVFGELAALAKTDIYKAVEIYNEVIGFCGNDNLRIYKKTGEKFHPSKEQINLERLLVKRFKGDLEKERIEKWKYFLIALFGGIIGLHRLAVNHKADFIFRLVLAMLFWNYFPYLFKLIWGTALFEAILTFMICETGHDGKTVPIGIFNIFDEA